MTLSLPGLAEANVRDAHGKPGEQCRKTGQGDEPVEDLGAHVRDDVDVRQGRENHDGEDAEEGAGGLVNVTEDLRKIPLVGKGEKRTSTSVDTGETHGENSDQDGGVDEVIEAFDVGPAHQDDHWGSVGSVAFEEEGLVVRNRETDHENDDQEQDDHTPDNALDGAGHGVHGIRSLGRSEGNEFGA